MANTLDDPTSTEASQAHRRTSLSGRDALLATCGAIGLNLLIYAIATAAGVDFVVSAFGDATDTTTVNVVHVVVSTLVGLAVGWLTVLAAGRIGRPSPSAVAATGGAVAVISCALPLMLDASVGVRASLALMHLAIGAIFIVALLRAGEVER